MDLFFISHDSRETIEAPAWTKQTYIYSQRPQANKSLEGKLREGATKAISRHGKQIGGN